MAEPQQGTEQVASYLKTCELANAVIDALSEKKASVGYGMLAAALSLGRLINHDRVMSDEEEVKWLEDCLDWSNLYFTQTGAKGDS